MKVKYLKVKQWLIVTLMGALGLASCKSHKTVIEQTTPDEPTVKPREEMKLMYGVPTMNYMIRGQVKDESGKPIDDLKVNILKRGMPNTDEQLGEIVEYLDGEAVTTKDGGRFEIKTTERPQESLRIYVRDVDGEKNGSFRNRVVEMAVEKEDVNKEDASGWNLGTLDKSVDITLERK